MIQEHLPHGLAVALLAGDSAGTGHVIQEHLPHGLAVALQAGDSAGTGHVIQEHLPHGLAVALQAGTGHVSMEGWASHSADGSLPTDAAAVCVVERQRTRQQQ